MALLGESEAEAARAALLLRVDLHAPLAHGDRAVGEVDGADARGGAVERVFQTLKNCVQL